MNFSVIKSAGSMIHPCESTPSGGLDLSVIDNLLALRCKARTLHVFRHGDEPSTVIKEALSKALVHYYPLAGRLVESGQGTVQVACTGEGVWFAEASANCSLEVVDYLDDALAIAHEELLPDHPLETDGVDPLVLMQVTRFTCDGFVIGLEFSHTICDGLGAAQFLNAVGESARGLHCPSVDPVWQREVLAAPRFEWNPPIPPLAMPPMPTYSLIQTSIDIPSNHICQFKRDFLKLTGQTCSAFEAIAAIVWRHRSRAINPEPNALATFVFFASTRHLTHPPLPQGYYGNCFFPVTVTVSYGTLLRSSNAEVVKLLQEAKGRLPREFAKWMAGDDMDGGNGRDPFAPPLSYDTLFLSEWGRLGFGQVDYGWGPPVHVVPIQGSAIIPVCILGSPPRPNTGFRLMTWCVERAHLATFRDQMMSLS